MLREAAAAEAAPRPAPAVCRTTRDTMPAPAPTPAPRPAPFAPCCRAACAPATTCAPRERGAAAGANEGVCRMFTPCFCRSNSTRVPCCRAAGGPATSRSSRAWARRKRCCAPAFTASLAVGCGVGVTTFPPLAVTAAPPPGWLLVGVRSGTPRHATCSHAMGNHGSTVATHTSASAGGAAAAAVGGEVPGTAGPGPGSGTCSSATAWMWLPGVATPTTVACSEGRARSMYGRQLASGWCAVALPLS